MATKPAVSSKATAKTKGGPKKIGLKTDPNKATTPLPAARR